MAKLAPPGDNENDLVGAAVPVPPELPALAVFQ